MTPPIWHSDGDRFTPRHTWTSHTIRVEVTRGRIGWYLTCRALGIEDSHIDMSAAMEPEAVQAEALAIVRARVAEMAGELAQ